MVANAFVDEAMNKISDASVKIYLLIIRKTRGWTKESDALSLRQLEIRAYFKYEKQAAAKTMVDGSIASGSTNTKREPKQLTEKQISAFAQKLAHLPEFASKHSAPGDSYEQLASRIKIKLMNPAQAKKWEPYLKQVGFTGTLMGATA
ncbi:hypothetical protein [Acinetobacter sp. TUM15064]|uniref:hypothetical protein n=1 Tax=Acinetobacter sp. TUM15064 TaxID=2609134 RepID=UPI00124C5BC2|nr:hypothetical protein [Acinetobacter sp. TUM15064]